MASTEYGNRWKLMMRCDLLTFGLSSLVWARRFAVAVLMLARPATFEEREFFRGIPQHRL